MTRCAECGSELDAGAGACPICSLNTGEDRIVTCPKCEENYRGGDSCPACGFAPVPIPCDLHASKHAEGRCVVCGRALCPECRGTSPDHRVYLCDQHASVVVIAGWAQVYDDANEFEAHLIRDNLVAEGIDARMYSQKDPMFSVGLGELSIVRILVPAWEFERAQQIILDHTDIEGSLSFACPVCGEAYEPGSDNCSECGARHTAGRGD